MGRVMAFDVGQKRTGIAVTDPLRLIATSLDTQETGRVWEFLTTYLQHETVDLFVVGWPTRLDNSPSDASRFVKPFIQKLEKNYPEKKIVKVDERFTSVIAHEAMIEGGVKKIKRRDKALADQISAVIILQSWMQAESINNTR